MRFLTKKQVCEKVGYSKQHLARLIAAGKFPPPAKPCGENGRCLWLESEVEDWMTQHLNKRSK